MENLEVIWKEVPGFNGRYAISIYGEVHDVSRNNIIKPHMSGVLRRNYPQVTLYNKLQSGEIIKHTKRVHSLMAITFLGHNYDGSRNMVVDHIDNNPMNNNLTNLRIVTAAENNFRNRKDL
jgi:hypothetical protein